MHHSCKLTSFCDVDVPRDGHAVLVGADREGNGRAALMVCPRCHAENREGRRFCGQCGLSFASTCPSCGFMNEGGEKFCGRLWQVADGNGRRDHRAPDAQGASESLRCRGGLMWHRSRLTTLAGLEFPRTRRPSPSSGASGASRVTTSGALIADSRRASRGRVEKSGKAWRTTNCWRWHGLTQRTRPAPILLP